MGSTSSGKGVMWLARASVSGFKIVQMGVYTIMAGGGTQWTHHHCAGGGSSCQWWGGAVASIISLGSSKIFPMGRAREGMAGVAKVQVTTDGNRVGSGSICKAILPWAECVTWLGREHRERGLVFALRPTAFLRFPQFLRAKLLRRDGCE